MKHPTSLVPPHQCDGERCHKCHIASLYSEVEKAEPRKPMNTRGIYKLIMDASNERLLTIARSGSALSRHAQEELQRRRWLVGKTDRCGLYEASIEASYQLDLSREMPSD